MDMSQRRVVCAANKLTNGKVILGARHWDELMVAAFDEHLASYDEVIDQQRLEIQLIDGEEQGFIDQWGVFMTRAEAWEVAVAGDQIRMKAPGCRGPDLYSENLY